MTATERLYELLPAIFKARDLEQGGSLRALLAVLESEFQAIEQDVDALYENWFIETCDANVVPYLADLLDDRLAGDPQHPLAHPRRWVSRLLGYRRRKGALDTLEQAIYDVTGWHAHCVEFQRQLGYYQRVDDINAQRGRTVDVRQDGALRSEGGPFDALTHRVDVREVESGNGKFNVNNLGVFLWRLESQSVMFADVGQADEGRYTFHPLGVDSPLFLRPNSNHNSDRPANEVDLPGPISPTLFTEHGDQLYGQDQQTLAVFYKEQLVPLANIVIRDLTDWDLSLLPSSFNRRPPSQNFPIVLLDVERGRLAIGQGDQTSGFSVQPSDLKVTYHVGRSGCMGGGGYARYDSLTDRQLADWPADPTKTFVANEVGNGLLDWTKHMRERENDEQAPAIRGVVRIVDNGSLLEPDFLEISLPDTGWLAIEAADGARPVLGRTDGQPLVLRVTGGGRDSALILNGLMIRGQIEIETPGRPTSQLNLYVRHCTITGGIRTAVPNLVPASMLRGARAIQPPDNDNLLLGVQIEHSILGPVCLPDSFAGLRVSDSVIDANDLAMPYSQSTLNGSSIAGRDRHGFGPSLSVERSTLFGEARVRRIDHAIDTIFDGGVHVDGPDVTRLPHCYLPNTDLPEARAKPSFASRTFGDPHYARLRVDNDPAFLTGAQHGGELGGFSELRQAERENILQQLLLEYAPVNLRAGMFYVT